MAPTLTVTAKVEFVSAAVELDLVDGVAVGGQVVEVSASWGRIRTKTQMRPDPT